MFFQIDSTIFGSDSSNKKAQVDQCTNHHAAATTLIDERETRSMRCLALLFLLEPLGREGERQNFREEFQILV